MFSLSKGRPIAIVHGGRYNNQILYLYDPYQKCCDSCSALCKTKKNKCCESCLGAGCGQGDEDKKERKEFIIHDGGKLQPLPNFTKTERLYIAGPTESGKSFYIKNFLLQYRKVYPHRDIHIFSNVESDKEIDVIPRIKKYKLDLQLNSQNGFIKSEKLANSMVVFDDIDRIQNKNISTIIKNLRDDLLTKGRHDDISVIVTNHLLTDYKDTRIILNESNSFTFYPKSGSVYGLNYILKTYLGLSKEQIKKVMNLNSRWVTIYKLYPNYVLYERGAFIL
jgi:hypothetical protein